MDEGGHLVKLEPFEPEDIPMPSDSIRLLSQLVIDH